MTAADLITAALQRLLVIERSGTPSADDINIGLQRLNDLIESSDITFEMYDVKTGEYVVLDGECSITNRIKKFDNTTDEYYIIYRFTEQQTDRTGRFEGKFIVQFLDEYENPTTKLILPIREKLHVNIV